MRVLRPPRKKYDLSFQTDAVSLLDQTDRSIRAVAEDLGLPQSTLYAWYKRAAVKKMGKLPSSKTSPSSAVMATSDPQTDKERIAQLERELHRVRDPPLRASAYHYAVDHDVQVVRLARRETAGLRQVDGLPIHTRTHEPLSSELFDALSQVTRVRALERRE